MSDEVCDLLLGLLEKDPNVRITPEEIQEHPWFKGLDWEALIQKDLKPPWKPTVHGPFDLSQIDPTVLQEAPIDTPDDRLAPGVQFSSEDEDLFAGFTYEGQEVGSLLKKGENTNITLVRM